MTADTRFCAKCGTPLEEDDRFCPNCGSPAQQQDTRQEQTKRAEEAPKASPKPETQEPQTQEGEPTPSVTSNRARPSELKKSIDKRFKVGLLIVVVFCGLFAALYFGLELLAEEFSPGFVYALALSPDQEILASSSTDGMLQLWDPGTGKTTNRSFIGHGTHAMTWSPDGSFLAAAQYDGIKLIAIPDLSTIRIMADSRGQSLALCLAPDLETLYSISSTEGLEVWDINQGSRRGALPIPWQPGSYLSSAGFSADCEKIIALHRGSTVPLLTVYKRTNMETLSQVSFPDYDSPERVGLNANGVIAIGVRSSQLNTWRTDSGKSGKNAELRSLFPTSLALGRKNSRFAIGGKLGWIHLYDGNGRFIQRMRHGTSLGLALVFLLE